MREIGAFEAKNRFRRLIDWVEHGEEIAVTQRGKAAAGLAPTVPGIDRDAARAAARYIRALRPAV